jgi:hypothetical protein
VPTDLRRFRFWVHDYAPLPASSAVQVLVVIGVVAGLVLALPFTGSLSEIDPWTIALVIVCIPLVVLGIVFVRRARYVPPKRWMMITGGAAGFVVGFGGQLLFAPG